MEEISEAPLGELVMNYLVHHGFPETTRLLYRSIHGNQNQKNEEGLIASILARRDIISSITAGKILESIHLISKLFPTLLTEKPEIRFEIQCQQFVELIRSQKINEALLFAQTDLKNFGEDHRFVSRLQDLIALIAYQEPESSPMGNLMHLNRRQELAEMVNSAMLAARGETSSVQLEQVIRQLTVVQSTLKEKQKPQWSFEQFMSTGNNSQKPPANVESSAISSAAPNKQDKS